MAHTFSPFAPPPSSSSRHRLSSKSASNGARKHQPQPGPKLEWSMFDRRVMHIHGPAPRSSTAAAAAESSTGQAVRVSLRLAPPPLTSYIEAHTDSSSSHFPFFGLPKLIAAHGDMALIHAVIAVPAARLSAYPRNFFLYRASPAYPSLRLLPSPSYGGWRDRSEFTGLLHEGGGDEFTVANLQGLAGAQGQEVAELFRYSSGSGEWELLRIDAPGDAGGGFYPRSWYTDTVFSHGSFMYWADYHQGLLSCDITADKPRLQFIKFPGIETKVDFDEGRGLPESVRTAAVSRGRIWFVDVDDGQFRSRRSSRRCSPKVTTWTLRGREWVQEHTLELREFWSGVDYRQSPLPFTAPEFPMLDLQEDGILHFIVREESMDSIEDWVATVDMKTSSLKAHRKYLNQIRVPNLTLDETNMFLSSALLCSQMCRCLNVPAND